MGGHFATLIWAMKIAAAVGGAIVGYAFSGPLVRLGYRLLVRRPIPAWLLPLLRVGAGAALAAVVFILVGLGGGGWGWGGDGSGAGGGASGKFAHQDKPATLPVASAHASRAKLEIELLGGKTSPGDGRYYLVRGQPPAKNLAELEELIRARAEQIEIHLVLTDDSVFSGHSAMTKLRDLLQRYRVPIVTAPER
ncbi:MAG: hypothetical protein NZO58_09420 [Gemmataceae bacterium]|nr:hypothetical protein [Gemmataceae bacterium]